MLDMNGPLCIGEREWSWGLVELHEPAGHQRGLCVTVWRMAKVRVVAVCLCCVWPSQAMVCALNVMCVAVGAKVHAST